MKKDAAKLALALFLLAVACPAEELLPGFAGVGAPALLSCALVFAVRRPPAEGLLFALAAGLCEDALASLPCAAATLFFTTAAAILRWRKLHWTAAIPAYPLYQLWLWTWFAPRMEGSVLVRAGVALVLGAATLAAAHQALCALERKAALDG